MKIGIRSIFCGINRHLSERFLLKYVFVLFFFREKERNIFSYEYLTNL